MSQIRPAPRDNVLMTESSLREAIVAECRSWVGTPYVLGACVKGAGVDCVSLLYGVMVGAKVIEPQTIGIFSQDWYCHTTEDTYLIRVMRHARKLLEDLSYPKLAIQPGCICLIRTSDSHFHNHGVVVLDWPMAVHAVPPCVEEINVSSYPMTSHKQIVVFDPVPVALERLKAIA